MNGNERKQYPPDQMNIRLGAKYIQEFNDYMEKHGGKKIDFIREAISYWMSVDGEPGELMQRVKTAETDARNAVERLAETKQHCDERINDLNRIIEEKDARIEILTQQFTSSLSLISQQALSAVPGTTQPANPAWTKEMKKLAP